MKAKRFFSLLLCLCMVLSCLPLTTHAATGISINNTNFPDENFRNYLLSQSYGSDGVLTEEEINQITYLNVSDMGIQNLDGIEFFCALTHLNCSNNQLLQLDLSGNTALTYVVCYHNQLKN